MKNKILAALAALTLLAQGCATRDSVVASTATSLGLDIDQNPTTQAYHAKFGFNRGELAIVPTNKRSNATNSVPGGSAKECADVIMELKYGSIFSLTSSSLYQRLAVGSGAVNQPGAALMFAKDSTGAIDAGTASAVLQSIKGVPSTPAPAAVKILPLLAIYKVSSKKDDFDSVARKFGFKDFTSIAAKADLSEDTVDKIASECKSIGLIP